MIRTAKILSIFLTLTSLATGLNRDVLAQGPDWKNPGGMWMPEQLREHAELLKKLGLSIDPESLASPTSALLQSIVHLGYCSGSFVSAQGLIFTNHHCVAGMLSYLSNQDRASGHSVDFVRHGFQAKSRSEERNGGPTERIFVTDRIVDVTDQILKGLSEIENPAERMEVLRARSKQVVKDAENARPEIRADLSIFYGGAKFYLTEKLEIKDVRLVHAPPTGIGNFAGDDDNWKWPRQTGDFSILRAYVGKDGKPAPYSPDNVPYEPKNFLSVSTAGVQANDLIFVAGYPGLTQRRLTFDQLENQITESIPTMIQVSKKMIGLYDKLGREDEGLRIKVESARKSLMNGLLNRESALANMLATKLLDDKKAYETAMQAWVRADASREKKYGGLLETFAALRAPARKRAYTNYLLGQIMSTSLIASSTTLNQLNQERQKPDEERLASFQKRQWKKIRDAESAKQGKYARAIDIGRLELLLELALELPKAEQPDWISLFIDEAKLTAGQSVREQLEALYAATSLEDEETRLKLLDATTGNWAKSKDPLVRIGFALTERLTRESREEDAITGELLLLMPKYLELQQAFENRVLPPDANSTLRVTFGTVKGYTDPRTGKYYHPFTTLSSMLSKAKAHDLAYHPEAAYDAPPAIFQAAAERRFGKYADQNFGEVPVNLLADVDTTGGNSGSAAMNKNGELIGLLFDGSSHSLGGDWKFTINQRSILLDIRYALWLLDEVYELKDLVAEMRLRGPDCNTLLSGMNDHKSG